MAIIDKVVKNLEQGKGEGFNCGGDSIDFNIPKVGKVIVENSDFESGFDAITIESGGKTYRFESKNFPNQFKKIGDYIGGQCSGGREVMTAGLGRKRERKVPRVAIGGSHAADRTELPELKKYEDIIASARTVVGPVCLSTVECQTLVARIEFGVEKPLLRLLRDVNLKLNNSYYTGLSKDDKRAYVELAGKIKDFIDRIDSWKYATDPTRIEPFLSWVAREYPENSR